MEKKKTLILGASANPARYSYLALNKLVANGHPVIAIGKKQGNVNNVQISTQPAPLEDIDTITLYLNPTNQQQYYDYILSLNPRRLIFNPGTENDALYDLAKKNGINVMEACTLVLLATGQY